MVSHLPTIDRQPLRLRTPKDGPMSRTRNWPSLPDVGILQRCQPWCLQRCSHRCSQSCQSSNLQRVHGLGVFRGAWPVPAPFQCCLGGARAPPPPRQRLLALLGKLPRHSSPAALARCNRDLCSHAASLPASLHRSGIFQHIGCNSFIMRALQVLHHEPPNLISLSPCPEKSCGQRRSSICIMTFACKTFVSSSV